MNVTLKKGVGILLSICMVLSLIPVLAFAQAQGGELTLKLSKYDYEFGTAQTPVDQIISSLYDGETPIPNFDDSFTYRVEFRPEASQSYVLLNEGKKAVLSHAGEYKITLTGNSGTQYEGRSGTAIFTVTPKSVSSVLKTQSGLSKEYDGTATVATTDGTVELEVAPTETLASEIGNIKLLSPVYSQKDVGDHILITGSGVSYTSTSDDAAKGIFYKDYKIEVPEIYGSITPKTVRATDLDVQGLVIAKPYDAGQEGTFFSTEGNTYVVGTDNKVRAIVKNVVRFESSQVGHTTATVVFHHLEGEGASNYVLENGEFEVANVPARIDKASMRYDGDYTKVFQIKEGMGWNGPESQISEYFSKIQPEGVNSEKVTVSSEYYKDQAGRIPLTEQEQKTLPVGIHTAYVGLKPIPAFDDHYQILVLPVPIRVSVSGLPKQDISWGLEAGNGTVGKVYGDARFHIEATNRTQGGGAISYDSSNSDVATIENDMVNIKGVGTTTITATAAKVDGAFAETAITYTLHVAKKQVKVKINDREFGYLESIKDLDLSGLNPRAYYVLNADENDGAADTGLVGQDTKNSVEMSLSTDAVKGDDVGDYVINGAFLRSDRYEVVGVIPGKLTITKGDSNTIDVEANTIKVSASKVQDIVFDVRPFFGAYEVQKLKLNGDPTDAGSIIDGAVTIDGTSIQFTTRSVAIGSAAPTATIPLKASFRNYTDKEFTVTIEIANKKTPNITGITIENKEYDGQPAGYIGSATVDGNMVDRATYRWFQGPQLLDAPPVKSAVSPYTLEVTVPETDEYEAATREYKFIISQRRLTVKPNDATMTAGSPLPSFTLNFGGTIGNETIDLTGGGGAAFTPQFEIRTVDGRAVNQNALQPGRYSIVFKNSRALTEYLMRNSQAGNNANYGTDNFTVREGVLTVNPAPNTNPSPNTDQGGESQNQGGEQSRRDGASNAAADNVEKTVVTKDTGKTVATVNAVVKTKEKTIRAEVSDRGIDHAIALAEKAAGEKQASALTIKVNASKNAEDVRLTLSRKATETLAKSKVETLTLESPVGRVT
ncbi:MAG: MBG domain-containing protein, partial [Bacillota bacterium]|nr:MBG domain-containing protein [Bacillota bacterium]